MPIVTIRCCGYCKYKVLLNGRPQVELLEQGKSNSNLPICTLLIGVFMYSPGHDLVWHGQTLDTTVHALLLTYCDKLWL